jgi:hypothetical protein
MEVKDTSMRRSEIDANPIPCPFCKSDGDILEMRIESEFHFCRVFCRECGTYGPYGQTIEESLRRWNRRSNVEKSTTCVLQPR